MRIKKSKCCYSIYDFTGVIPMSSIEEVLSRGELKQFEKFMRGQTMALLKEQAGVFSGDLYRFLKYNLKRNK